MKLVALIKGVQIGSYSEEALLETARGLERKVLGNVAIEVAT